MKTLVLSLCLSTVVLGIIGFLLAGVSGLVNMAIWGAVLGLVGGAMSGLAAMGAKHAEEIGGNFSRWHEQEEAKKLEP